MPFCPKCGREVETEDRFCPNCRQVLSRPPPEPHSIRIGRRPPGVTVLALLEVLSGIVFFGLGFIILIIANILGTGVQPPDFPILGGIVGVIVGLFGGVMVILALMNFIIAYGYWNGLSWSWTLGLIFAVLGILLGLITLPGGLLRVILDAVIIYYLTRPYVKAFFGKEPFSI
jgi:hypothetical protein